MSNTTLFELPFWQEPVPFLQTTKDKLLVVISICIFTPLFLIIFQPFGVNNYDPTHAIGVVFALSAVGFGFINGLTIAIYEFILVPVVFRKNNVLVFVIRIALELIFLASTTFLFYNYLGGFHDWNWQSYLGFIRDVSLMSALPLFFLTLYFKYRLSKSALEAVKLELPSESSNEPMVWLQPSNGRDRLGVYLSQLLFIEAQDNYVAVHYLEQGREAKLLLRSTLKRLESQLNAFTVMRCHRSFLVNVNQVRKITGNQHQRRLFLSQIDKPIPVSRSYIPALEGHLAIRHK